MANTFIELNDTPSSLTGQGLKYLRVNGTGDQIIFVNPVLDDLADIQADGAYLPQGGQALIYSSAAGKWRPGTMDVYSAGNGLNKNALTLNVQAGSGGGLTSNSSGVYITDIDGVAGTWGNAAYIPVISVNSKGQITDITPTEIVATQAETITGSFVGNIAGTAGQIRVTGGTGNNSNAVIDLVATGVTAATYGNTTHLPRITVDTYGRIQNVDLIEIAGGGGSGSGNALGFGNIIVAGQTTVSADQASDNLTLVAGSGVSITTQANADIITFGVDAGAIASQISLNDLNGVNTTGIANNQILRWVAANSAFEPYTLTDSGILLTDLSAGTGLSYNNTTGVFSLTNTSVAAGTYGNATHVPQVTVDAQGRVTNLTNVSLATGVTPGTYGNATSVPRFTVDATGRITNVSVVSSATYLQSLSWNADTSNLTISGGNTVNLSALKDKNAFTVMRVGGVSATADQNDDVFNFVAGPGIALSLDASTDTLTISSTGGSGSGGIALTDLSVTSASPSGNGSLTYNNATGTFTFTPTAPQTLSLTGNVISIARGNSVDITAALASVAGNYSNSNVSAYLKVTNTNIIPSANNTYTLGNATNKWSELYLSGNSIYINGSTISASGSNLLFDGNSLATQAYVNSAVANVSVDLTGYATENYVDAANADMKAYVDAGLSNVTVDLTGYATESYVTTAINNVLDGAPAALDTLNEIANALNGSNSTLSAVAFSGNYSDLTNRPTLSVVGNTYLVYDGSNVDLSGVVGQKGDKGDTGNAGVDGNDGISVTNAAVNGSGNLIITLSDATTVDAGNVRGANGTNGTNGNDGNDGADGVSVTNATVTGANLIITLSNSTTINAGNVQGPQGDVGPQGDGNAGISTAVVNGSGNLIITLNDSTVIDAGNVKGATGPKGDTGNAGVNGTDGTDGVGITNVTLVGGNLVLDYSNTSTQDIGNIQGPQGAAGVDVTSATVNGSGNLIITLSDASTIDAGNVKGADGTNGTNGNDGADGIQLTDISVTTASPSGNGSLTYNNATGVFTFTPANLSSVQSNYGDSNVAAYLAANGFSSSDSDNQTLSLSGSNLSISGGNTVDLSGLGGSTDLTGYATEAYVDAAIANVSAGGGDITSVVAGNGLVGGGLTGDVTLNIGAGTGINVTADAVSLANSGVTAGTYGNATKSPRITVDQYGRVTSVTETTITGTGGGSGATVERFKLNYNSSGNLSGTANLSAGIATVTIDSSTGGECTITFANGTYFFPPTGIMFYGYDYSNNKYQIVPMETSMGFREVPAGGSSGSPTLFNGASQVVVKLRLREAETGASRGGFGTTTHAWIQFVMYD